MAEIINTTPRPIANHISCCRLTQHLLDSDTTRHPRPAPINTGNRSAIKNATIAALQNIRLLGMDEVDVIEIAVVPQEITRNSKEVEEKALLAKASNMSHVSLYLLKAENPSMCTHQGIINAKLLLPAPG